MEQKHQYKEKTSCGQCGYYCSGRASVATVEEPRKAPMVRIVKRGYMVPMLFSCVLRLFDGGSARPNWRLVATMSGATQFPRAKPAWPTVLSAGGQSLRHRQRRTGTYDVIYGAENDAEIGAARTRKTTRNDRFGPQSTTNYQRLAGPARTRQGRYPGDGQQHFTQTKGGNIMNVKHRRHATVLDWVKLLLSEKTLPRLASLEGGCFVWAKYRRKSPHKKHHYVLLRLERFSKRVSWAHCHSERSL